jgi:hypothetical protein
LIPPEWTGLYMVFPLDTSVQGSRGTDAAPRLVLRSSHFPMQRRGEAENHHLILKVVLIAV